MCPKRSIKDSESLLKSQTLSLNQTTNLTSKCYSLVNDQAALYVVYIQLPKHAASRNNTKLQTLSYYIQSTILQSTTTDHNFPEATLIVAGPRHITLHIQFITETIASCFNCQTTLAYVIILYHSMHVLLHHFTIYYGKKKNLTGVWIVILHSNN